MSTLELPGTEDLGEVVLQVWSSLLEPDGVVAPADPAPALARHLVPTEGEPASWSAVIDVRGAEPRRVTVVLEDDAARTMTQHLLRVASPSPEDIADALGELVNIVGGNLKSLMPEPSTLSLPSAAPGAPAYDADQPVSAVEAFWNGRPVLVTVHDPHSQGALQ